MLYKELSKLIKMEKDEVSKEWSTGSEDTSPKQVNGGK